MFQHTPFRARGISMIEVLVTIVILAFGLLGLFGLQARLQQAEMESYQRAQALILLDDMANRIAANRKAAASYVTGTTGTDSPLGTDGACTYTSSSTLQQKDACQWHNALLGAAEVAAGGSKVGALIGGRGCIEQKGTDDYLITVAWQGTGRIARPTNDALLCGQSAYNGGVCSDDQCRRTVSTRIYIGTLN